ncbi:hypothetical protein MSPP1_003455 [Malassezia sp. CBS 17886]|nr:hypothetical protein MSPP1_003455 [Malassezia sp. CBS 17886]
MGEMWVAPFDGANGTQPDIPGPAGRRYAGPWLQQQIVLSLGVGLLSFVLFGFWKRHYPSLFLARHLSQGSALPYRAMRNSFLGWIMPTVAYADHAILHTIGLDAAVALLFLKMGFHYLLLASLWAVLVLMPVNYYCNGWIDGVTPGESADAAALLRVLLPRAAPPPPQPLRTHRPDAPLPWLPLPVSVTRNMLYENTQLVSTYLYSLLALWMLWRTYTVFIRLRQGHAGLQVRGETARTVSVHALPEHLAHRDALAAYFAELRLEVESVQVLEDTRRLDAVLLARVAALQRLEQLWTAWVGDPAAAEHYQPARIVQETSGVHAPAQPNGTPVVGADVRTRRPRPTVRTQWWNPCSPRIDAIDQASYEFVTLDEEARAMRHASFKHGRMAFVTFCSAASAQIASQVVHYPTPGYCHTEPAVEPRDIIWVNEDYSWWDRRLRQVAMAALMAVFLLFFYVLQGAMFLGFESMRVISKYLPWLGRLLDSDPRVRAFVQKNLPTLLLTAFNACVPAAMQESTYFQRIRTRSSIDDSVVHKYYLYLLFSVVFIFMVTGTIFGVLSELAENPMRLLDKFAQSLPAARNFSLSYVIFQALAIQPLQLLQLSSILARVVRRLFVADTPRERTYMHTAPVMRGSVLYPQALLVFTLSVLYGIVSPLIVVFGAIYFGVAYVVLKYQLLNVLDKPYESHGSAWPLAVTRCIWACYLFQIFQLSLFSVRKEVVSSLLIIPLIMLTAWFHSTVEKTFAPLTSHLNLYDIYASDDGTDSPGTPPPAPTPPSVQDADAPMPREPPLSWNHPGLLLVRPGSYSQPALSSPLPNLWLPPLRSS